MSASKQEDETGKDVDSGGEGMNRHDAILTGKERRCEESAIKHDPSPSFLPELTRCKKWNS